MVGFIQPTNNESLPSISQFFSQYISGVDSIVAVRYVYPRFHSLKISGFYLRSKEESLDLLVPRSG